MLGEVGASCGGVGGGGWGGEAFVVTGYVERLLIPYQLGIGPDIFINLACEGDSLHCPPRCSWLLP